MPKSSASDEEDDNLPLKFLISPHTGGLTIKKECDEIKTENENAADSELPASSNLSYENNIFYSSDSSDDDFSPDLGKSAEELIFPQGKT